MQINPYLSFNGECAAAFAFYARCLGGQVGPLFRYAGSPMAGQAPADWGDKVMHGSVTVCGLELMGGDVAPGGYEAPRGFSLSIHMDDPAAADRIFGELAAGGRVLMPLEQTFWAARFGMAVDRFGIPWMVNCGGESPEP